VLRDKAKFVVHGQVPEEHFGTFSEKPHPEGTTEELFRQRGSCHGPEAKKNLDLSDVSGQKNLDLSDVSGQRKRSNIFLIFDRTGLSIFSQGDDVIVHSSVTDRLTDLFSDSKDHTFPFY